MLESLIDIAKGKRKADILLKGANLVNVFSGEIYPANVATFKNFIVGVGADYKEAKEIFNLRGKYLLPGFIEGHLHLESSLLSPSEFAKTVLPRGTTTIVIDPHEIANVLGVAGFKYILKATQNLPLSVFLMASSCVPATTFETAGATLTATAIKKLLKEERVLGLAEMMNFPGVIFKNRQVLAKIKVTESLGKIIDGHAPGLTGPELQAYVTASIASDHECTTTKEALEKLRLGLRVMIREGSAAQNLESLLPIVNKENSRRLMLVSDDRHPDDLLRQGHLDQILRKAVSLRVDPFLAIQMVTLNPAEYFGLRKRGAIVPGYLADLVVVDNLSEFTPLFVFKDGKLVAKNGKILKSLPRYKDKAVKETVRLISPKIKDLAIKASLPKVKVKVIGLVPRQIVAKKLVLEPEVKNGQIVSDAQRDILKIAVFERHRKSGRVGLGLVQGFGLKKGAIASSVAHDSHNIVAVGVSDKDLILAVKKIKKMAGGFVVASEGKIKAALPLSIAGLMSEKPLSEVVKALETLKKEAKKLGAKPENPFITLSFLSLPVIPQLKLTDKGLVDVEKFSLVPLAGPD